MKSKQYIFLKCRNQDKHRDFVFEVRLNCHVTLNPTAHCSTVLWTSPEGCSCWGPLFELTAGGVQHPLALCCTFSPALPQSSHTVTIDSHRILRGLKPPTAAVRLVNVSTQVDHLSAPGVELCRAAHVSCCLLLSQRITKVSEDPWGPAENGSHKTAWMVF